MKEIEDLKVSQGISSAITGVRDGELAALLARVEQAEGPDRELDREIGILLLGWEPVRINTFPWLREPDGPAMWSDEPKGGFPSFTASLDAALALCARVLPDANCRGFDETPREVVAYVSRNCVGTGHWLSEGYAKTPVLALVAAVLKRLIARPKDDTAERSTEPRETRK